MPFLPFILLQGNCEDKCHAWEYWIPTNSLWASRVQEQYCQAKCAAEFAQKITRIWEGLSG